ncbi:MAG: DUF3375 family protein, partial [Polaromonas sp.]
VPAYKPRLASGRLDADDGGSDVDAAALFSQVVIDKAQLAGHIRHTLQDRPQVTLQELAQLQPLQQGLAELVAYLQLADDTFSAVIDESATDVIAWQGLAPDGQMHSKQARLPRVIFLR